MRVLITGAAGFIGSRLVSSLAEIGCACLGVDNLWVGTQPLVERRNLFFRVLDICATDALWQVFREFQPEVVVQLAAIHHIPTCERDRAETLRVNVVGFQTVLDAAEQCGCRRVVLASSGAVYDWVEGPLNEERTPVCPRDTYSLSKATNEAQAHLWSARTRRAAIVARIFNTIGENDPNAHLIPDILSQLNSATGHCAIRLGNAHSRRDYLYVQDAADCLQKMVLSPLPDTCQVFNIGTGRATSVMEIVDQIARLRGCSYQIEIDPTRLRRTDRPSQIADTSKTSNLLGWSARFTLESALANTAGKSVG